MRDGGAGGVPDRHLRIAGLIGMMIGLGSAMAADAPQTRAATTRPVRSRAPTRDPHTPGYVTATELADGQVPSADADGNFIIGPTHAPAPEMTVQDGVPRGAIFDIVMKSADSKFYPGIAREVKTFGTVDPNDPARLIVTTSHPAPYTRHVTG